MGTVLPDHRTHRRALLDRLLAGARELDDGRLSLDEAATKAALRSFGVATPQAWTAANGADLAAAITGRHGRYVLKAFGDGLVHKSDVGAVVLGLGVRDIVAEVAAMGQRLAAHGIAADGFLVEEQQDRAVELLVGVARRPPFGHVVMLGLGGVLTEVVAQTWTRLLPLTPADAESLVEELPRAVLAGARGQPALDRAALAGLLVAIAGEDGFVAALGDSVDELECNPVLAGADSAVAVDARLILRPPVPELADDAGEGDGTGAAAGVGASTAVGGTSLLAVFEPRAIAVAGASTSRRTFGNWFLDAYRAAGWTDGLYALHPTATEVDGVPAVASLDQIDGGVDYLLSAVPAKATADLVRANGARARFVQVISGGFAEVGDAGADMETQLLAAAAATGTRIIGPNCMGAFSPLGRQTFFTGSPSVSGTVAVVSQSGSLAGEIVRTGDARGIAFSRVVTVGNSADVTPGEVLDWLLDDPATDVVGMYLEGPRDPQLIRALRRSTGRTPVVVLAGGLSRQGSAAAASHTGALAGDASVWAAISASLGVAVVATVEQFLATLSYLQRFGAAASDAPGEVVIVGPGGGASVLATDAFDRAGRDVTAVPVDVRAQIAVATGYGSGTSLANPIEIPLGPAAPPDALDRVLMPLLAGFSYGDVIIHLNISSYYGFGDGGIPALLATIERIGTFRLGGTRIGVVLRGIESASGADERRIRDALHAARVVAFRDFDEAAVAVRAAATCAKADQK